MTAKSSVIFPENHPHSFNILAIEKITNSNLNPRHEISSLYSFASL
jgi:hypothetical protein